MDSHQGVRSGRKGELRLPDRSVVVAEKRNSQEHDLALLKIDVGGLLRRFPQGAAFIAQVPCAVGPVKF
jgi:hypothetical protein